MRSEADAKDATEKQVHDNLFNLLNVVHLVRYTEKI